MLTFDIRTMSVGVEHDDCHREIVAGVLVIEAAWIRFMITHCKALHHAIDLLSFAGQAKARQQVAQRFANMHAAKIKTLK